MSKEDLMGVLEDFGLTKKEIEVYIFLAKSGVKKGGEVADALKMHQAEAYRILKDLETKGIVQSTIEVPLRFTATPLEKILDSIINLKKEESISLQERKPQLLAFWKSISTERPAPPLDKFEVLMGGSIYSKIREMISEAENRVSIAARSLGVIQPPKADHLGFADLMEKRSIELRLLVPVSKNDVNEIKWAISEIRKEWLNVSLRSLNQTSDFTPNFLIKDDDEVILLVSPAAGSTVSESDVCLWTNSKTIVQTLKIFYETIWQDAPDASAKVLEIEKGVPAEETIIFKKAQQAYDKFHRTVEDAREEIIGVTSSHGLIRMAESFGFDKLSKSGVKVRLMAPITPINAELASNLSSRIQIRHINVAYVRLFIVDKEHLMQLKTPPVNEDTLEPATYFDHMLFTSDHVYVKGMRDLLEDLWNRSPGFVEKSNVAPSTAKVE